MSLYNSNRLIRDANLRGSAYLPAANATANITPFNGNIGAGTFKPEGMEIEVAFPALPNHTNTGLSITATLQDSADGVTFANTNPLIQASVLGVAATGSLATVFRFRPPANIRQYFQIQLSVPSTDGNNTAAQVTIQILL